ncbi:MAG: hypothetical protein ACYC6N_06430, partial [Pirellulaceae bacterium]
RSQMRMIVGSVKEIRDAVVFGGNPKEPSHALVPFATGATSPRVTARIDGPPGDARRACNDGHACGHILPVAESAVQAGRAWPRKTAHRVLRDAILAAFVARAAVVA